MPITSRLVLCLAAPAAFMACIEEPTVSTGEALTAWEEDCPIATCSNAAHLGDAAFYELNRDGVPNGAGVVLTSFRTSWLYGSVPLTVVGDHIEDAPGHTVIDAHLANARMLVTRDSVDYEIIFKAAGETDYWVTPIDGVPENKSHVYDLRYRQVGDPTGLRALCPSEDLTDDPEWDKIPDGNAFLFAGDRYDVAAKTVSSAPTNGPWFNVACKGFAMAKMHLLRHTEAGSNANRQTDVHQRTTMLKMLTDDICGNGTTYTIDGEHLYYMDRRAWHPFMLGTEESIEAIWNEDGAVCLSHPRREAEGDVTYQEIHAICPEKTDLCKDDMVLRWRENGYVISANPVSATP